MPKVIGIDASRAVRQNRTGTENYSWFLIPELLKLDPTNHYRLYAPYLPKEDFPAADNVEWRILPPRRLWSQIQLAKEIRQSPPDVLFVPSHVVPIFSGVKSIVTIHDLAYKFYPDAYSSFDRRYLNFSTGVSASKSKKILVPSESTKHDLLKFYKVDADKIVVTPLGYSHQVFNPEANYGDRPMAEPYLFYLGRIEGRKNTAFLVEAFALLAKEIKNVRLVMAGKPGHDYDKVQEKIAVLPASIKERIIQPGYMPNQETIRHLQHAAAFVFPSYYEGFGIAVLEAMAMGTPVVCSNTSSLPEVVGDGGILLEPTNALAWAAALSRILHSETYAKNLRQKGLAQAQKFSWQRTAQLTLPILQDVAAA